MFSGPMEKPALKTGAVKVWRTKGKEWTETVVAVDEDTVTYERSNGCTLTRPHEEFAQLLKWGGDGCPLGSGKGTTRLTGGAIWPLQVGGKFVYEYAGKNSMGRSWKGKMKCAVKKEARISVPAGDLDTYRVDCDTKNIKRVYYISPDLGTTVKYVRRNLRRNSSSTQELVSYAPGN